MIYENLNRRMTLLEKETEMLPKYTPMFLSDIGGRIAVSKNIKADKDDFLSVARIIDETERENYLSQREKRDCLVMRMKKSPKDLLVLTKTDSDILQGVVCSYSENNCIRLDDYYEKLLSYRDYLDFHARLSVTPEIHMPALRLFEVRMGGASQLLELSRVGVNAEDCVEIPLYMISEKVALFVKNVSENSAVRISLFFDEDRSASLPLSFLGLLVSCITLAIRYSRDAHIKIGTQNVDSRHTVLIIETNILPSHREFDIYEDAVMSAFVNMGVGFSISKHDGLYSMQMSLETAELKKEVLAESDELSMLVSDIFTSSNISDIVYTILP